MMLDTGIGVVVTYHNQATTIERCLQSLRQSKDLYVVVIDDGSEHLPPIELSHLADEIICFPKSRGVQEARNYGFERIRSRDLPYVLFTDGDIEWMPGVLNILRSTLEAAPNAAYAYCDYHRRGSFYETWRAGGFSDDRLRKESFISTMSLCRTGLLPKIPFDPVIERFQDWDLWLRLLSKGHRGVYVPQILFTAFYADGDTSLKGRDHCQKWKQEVLRKHVD